MKKKIVAEVPGTGGGGGGMRYDPLIFYSPLKEVTLNTAAGFSLK
jgi:hypothetical protein